MRKVLLMGLIGSLLLSLWAGCGSGLKTGMVVLERRPDEDAPTEVPKDREGKILYFLGTRTRATREEDGRSDALNDATSYVVRYMGQLGVYDYERARHETGSPISDQEVGRLTKEGNIILAERLIRGLQAEKWYIKQYYFRDRPKDVFYDIHLVASVSKEDLEKIGEEALDKQFKQEQERNNQEAAKFLEKMKKLFKLE